LKIIEKNNHGSYPIIEATKMNNIEMVKLLIEYIKKKIILF